jgi:exonuclease III
MVNVLCWNCRGLGRAKRRRLLKEYIVDNKIDILGIQETKLESLPDRTLNFVSSSLTAWFFKPSVGNSGGIMIGINDDLFIILNTIILDFSITI